MERIEFLKQEITKANAHYWKTGENYISDDLYHQYIEELKTLDQHNELLDVIDPTTLSINIEKVVHDEPMLSLDKVYTIDELKKWMKSVSRSSGEVFSVMPKYDGIAAKAGNEQLSTRGNGHIGENISHKINLINFANFEYRNTKFVYGEIIMMDSIFHQFFKEGNNSQGYIYKNTRNAVTGILSNDNFIWNEKRKPLVFVPYSRNEYNTRLDDIENAIDIMTNVSEIYPCDGLVIKLTDEEYGKTLGYTSHHYKHSIALKFTNPKTTSKLIGVKFNTEKEYIGIVGEIEPVELSGVTVSNVTLHNLDFIEKLDLHIGDIVTIERAGDVIPHIVGSIAGTTREKINLIKCPSCNEDVVRDKQFYVCKNKNCMGRKKSQILASIRTFNIERISEATILKLLENKFINSIVDVFKLQKNHFMVLPGFGDKSSDNCIEEITKCKLNNVYDYQILAALNISGIGESLSKTILKYVDIADIIDKLDSGYLPTTVFENIPQMAEERIKTLVLGLYEQRYILKGLVDVFPNYYVNKAVVKNDNTICFTGKMEKPRSYYESIASNKGFTPVDSVSKTLSLLVCDDVNSGSSKTLKAKKLGIKIMSLDEFMKLYGE